MRSADVLKVTTLSSLKAGLSSSYLDSLIALLSGLVLSKPDLLLFCERWPAEEKLVFLPVCDDVANTILQRYQAKTDVGPLTCIYTPEEFRDEFGSTNISPSTLDLEIVVRRMESRGKLYVDYARKVR